MNLDVEGCAVPAHAGLSDGGLFVFSRAVGTGVKGSVEGVDDLEFCCLWLCDGRVGGLGARVEVSPGCR